MVPLTQHVVLCKCSTLVDPWSANSNTLLKFFFQGTSWMVPLTQLVVLYKWSALVDPWSANSNPFFFNFFYFFNGLVNGIDGISLVQSTGV
mgnify:CR=1 FL=1